MPHFALIIDPDPESRTAFCRRAGKILQDTFQLQGRHEEAAGAGLVYVTGQVARNSTDPETLRYQIFADEYGMRLEMHDGALTLRTDLLGLYPVFYWHADDTFICASSPSFFPAHARFRPVLDDVGLMLNLLIMHTACGRTLWRGVRRLPAATELHWSNGTATERAREWPSIELQEMDGETLHREIDAHFLGFFDNCDPAPVLLLSGGLDSRIVAGYLQKAGKRARALTLGEATDSEVRIARTVARAAGLRHEVAPVDLNRYPEWAQRQIDTDHVTTGVSDFASWALADLKIPEPITSGYFGDTLMGGTHIEWAWDASTGEFTFDRLWRQISRYGLPLEKIRRLLRIANADAVLAEAKTLLQREYESYPGYGYQKAWRFDLHNRQRHHIGKIIWRTALASRPRIPYAAPGLLALCARLPLQQIRYRAVQLELLTKHFPHLARLPQDRNSFDTRPLMMNWRQRQWWKVQSRLAARWRALTGQDGIETRYYFRLYNFNTNPGWLTLRKQALGVADSLSDLFDPALVRELIPAPPALLKVSDQIIDTAGSKTLCCLLLWASRYAH